MNTNDYPGIVLENEMVRLPEKICAYIDWNGNREWYAFLEELHEHNDVVYIRADIVAVKDDNFRDLAYQHGAALRDVAHYKAEVTRLENIIADMAAREVDAAQRLAECLEDNNG